MAVVLVTVDELNGQRGTVTAVDPDAGSLTVQLGGTTATHPTGTAGQNPCPDTNRPTPRLP